MGLHHQPFSEREAPFITAPNPLLHPRYPFALATQTMPSPNCTEFFHSSSGGYFMPHAVNASDYFVFDPLLGVNAAAGESGGRHAVANASIVPFHNTSKRAKWSFPASEGQDKLVLKLLNGKTGGFYVDLAARYWHKGSNTFALDYYYQWKGT